MRRFGRSACGTWSWPRRCRRTIKPTAATTSTAARRVLLLPLFALASAHRASPELRAALPTLRARAEPGAAGAARDCRPVWPGAHETTHGADPHGGLSRRRPARPRAGAGHHRRAGPRSHGAGPAHAALRGLPARHRARRARSHRPHGHGDAPGRVRVHGLLVRRAHRAESRHGRALHGWLDRWRRFRCTTFVDPPAGSRRCSTSRACRAPLAAARRRRVRASAPAAGRDDAHQGGVPGDQGAGGHRLRGAAVQLPRRRRQRRAPGTRAAASAKTSAPASTSWPRAIRAASCGRPASPSAPGSRSPKAPLDNRVSVLIGIAPAIAMYDFSALKASTEAEVHHPRRARRAVPAEGDVRVLRAAAASRRSWPSSTPPITCSTARSRRSATRSKICWRTSRRRRTEAAGQLHVSMKDAVIVSAVRTAIGKAPAGTLRTTRPDDMAAATITRGACARAAGSTRPRSTT